MAEAHYSRSMQLIRLRHLAIALAVVLASSACGSDDSAGTSDTTSTQATSTDTEVDAAGLADDCDALATRTIELVQDIDASLEASVSQIPTDCAVSYLQPGADPLVGGYFYLHLFHEPAGAFDAGKRSFATGTWSAAATGTMTRDEEDRFEYRGGLDQPRGGHVYVFGLQRNDTYYSLVITNLRDDSGALMYKDELESMGETLAAEL